ncbi:MULTISPECIES: hypothetical protein [Klebsiella pneumoniae complex]|uniref:hypothetical protein n=1 Tax=Klebsiella pneumoniae complex TaxID=3390273 RepID=UPI000671FA4E|nr:MULTISPECIES: hypothetical protein [Klebsiella]HBZ7661143.1 hypothetical protein [Klebsiella variicola subsp. variicola]MBN7737761.1 hypothetical protein [Klebsiella variicola]MCF6970152.1 hypothetical protein [Klebsiella variicola]MCJ6258327.1 hypothetical protein [Klebsiella pneumoniae]MCY0049417.1 hypothetical protein [Klebsiella quasipneumoniae]
MSEDLLQEAIKKLVIHSVLLRESQIHTKEKVNSLNFKSFSAKHQAFRRIDKIESIEVSAKDDPETIRFFYSFHYDVGARIIDANSTNEQVEEDIGLVVIEAKFEALYMSKEVIPEEQLKAFSANNVGYHVWPYWREYLQTTCNRMGIDPINVPFYRIQGSDLPAEN